MVDITCPKCGSNQTQPLHIIFSQGTVTGQTVTNSYGMTSSGNMVNSVGVGNYSGSSVLAQRLAPPKKPESVLIMGIVGLIVMGGFGLLVISATANSESAKSGSPLGLVCIFVGILFLIYGIISQANYSSNMPIYIRNFDEWAAKRYCFTCGNTYKPNENIKFSSSSSRIPNSNTVATSVTPKRASVFQNGYTSPFSFQDGYILSARSHSGKLELFFDTQPDDAQTTMNFRLIYKSSYAGSLPAQVTITKPEIRTVVIEVAGRMFIQTTLVYFSATMFVLLTEDFSKSEEKRQTEEKGILPIAEKLIYDWLSGKIPQAGYENLAERIIDVMKNNNSEHVEEVIRIIKNNSYEQIFEKRDTEPFKDTSTDVNYSDKITKLKQAGEMLKDGLITKEEFERIKNRLIG
jgi:hypothetical protein